MKRGLRAPASTLLLGGFATLSRRRLLSTDGIPPSDAKELIMPDYATGRAGDAPFLAVVSDPKAFSLPHRTFHNKEYKSKPWESSCIEVSGGDLRFYFETATKEGVMGYHNVARAVALGQLPGTTKNVMSAGFAVWIVPRDEYQQMLKDRQGIEE